MTELKTEITYGIGSSAPIVFRTNERVTSDRREMKAIPEHCKIVIDPTKAIYDFRATLDQLDMIELVPHGELVALKERDEARVERDQLRAAIKNSAVEHDQERAALRDEYDLLLRKYNTLADGCLALDTKVTALIVENARLHGLLAQRPVAFTDPDQKPEHNPFRDHADDPRRIGSMRGLA